MMEQFACQFNGKSLKVVRQAVKHVVVLQKEQSGNLIRDELQKEEATYDVIVIMGELMREVAVRPENMR